MTQKDTINGMQTRQQEQLLRLVTQSFYRELVNYGANIQDIVKVTTNLLDQVTSESDTANLHQRSQNKTLTIGGIEDCWETDRYVQLNTVRLSPTDASEVLTIEKWLNTNHRPKTLIDLLPLDRNHLTDFLLNNPNHQFFSIFFGDHVVGLIGGDNIDPISKKLEMKKMIGDPDFQGKGIGTRATFLFLYYVFVIMGFNKVYLHSVDTNIRNINLNTKFGFELEGIAFQDVYLDGAYRDVVRMGLLRHKWESLFPTT